MIPDPLHLGLLVILIAFSNGIQPFAKSVIMQNKISIDIKVPVQLGVMSRCPDALICESLFDQILPNITDYVTLSTIYVANDPNFGVKCLHGRQECAANVQQLCVGRYAAFQTWWDFLRCQNAGGQERIGTPSLALECAEGIGLSWDGSGVGSCAGTDASGEAPEGVAMLQESVKLTHQLQVRKSCTVLINEKVVCIHDGSWKDCKNGHEPKDFVEQIEEEYARLNGVKTYRY